MCMVILKRDSAQRSSQQGRTSNRGHPLRPTSMAATERKLFDNSFKSLRFLVILLLNKHRPSYHPSNTNRDLRRCGDTTLRIDISVSFNSGFGTASLLCQDLDSITTICRRGHHSHLLQHIISQRTQLNSCLRPNIDPYAITATFTHHCSLHEAHPLLMYR